MSDEEILDINPQDAVASEEQAPSILPPLKERLENFSEQERQKIVELLEENYEHLIQHGLINPEVIDTLVAAGIVKKNEQPNPDVPIVAAYDDGPGQMEIYDQALQEPDERLQYMLTHEIGHAILESGLVYSEQTLEQFSQAALIGQEQYKESEEYKSLPPELQFILDSINNPSLAKRECRYLSDKIHGLYDPDILATKVEQYKKRHEGSDITTEKVQAWMKRDIAKELLNERMTAYLLSDKDPISYFSQVRKEEIGDFLQEQNIPENIWQTFLEHHHSGQEEEMKKILDDEQYSVLKEFVEHHLQMFQLIKESVSDRGPEEIQSIVSKHTRGRKKETGFGTGYYPEEQLYFENASSISNQPSLLDMLIDLLMK